MKTILLLLKFLSLITGLAAYTSVIPPKYMAVAALVFAGASFLKDFLLKLGDYLDDGQLNNSFQPGASQSSPPSANGGSSKTGGVGVLVALAAASFLFVTGCASLDPGARAVVVRTEQSLTVANSTFNAVVHIDDANRPFFRTNAPAFHNFAEWLRTPVVIAPLTNAEPRGIAIIRSANAVKIAYKANPGTNSYAALINSLAAVETASSQAQSWLSSLNATATK